MESYVLHEGSKVEYFFLTCKIATRAEDEGGEHAGMKCSTFFPVMLIHLLFPYLQRKVNSAGYSPFNLAIKCRLKASAKLFVRHGEFQTETMSDSGSHCLNK